MPPCNTIISTDLAISKMGMGMNYGKTDIYAGFSRTGGLSDGKELPQ